MKYLKLPENTTRILPFYLAMEEYAARIIEHDDIFFMWQVNPTVIFGRNQLIQKEVNLDYCKSHGIETYRRKSGGGCVYADMSNIMFSYITCSDNVETTFGEYTENVAAMLRTLGLNATAGGRNDVLIDGLKVSGNAFYHLPGRSIVHGTMLYDTDMENMMHAITPSHVKLESKGVDSVRKHITTLNQHLNMGIEEFKAYVRSHLCDGEIALDASDVKEIEEITKTYLTPEFIYGSNPRCSMVKHGRIEGVGELEVSLELSHNIVKNVNIAGDFFLLGNIDDGLLNRLKGANFTPDDVAKALEGVKLNEIIMNLNIKQLITLLFE